MEPPNCITWLTCFHCGRLMMTDQGFSLVKEPINWTQQTDRSAVCSTETLEEHYFGHGHLWSSPVAQVCPSPPLNHIHQLRASVVFTLDNSPDKFENFQLSAVFQPMHWFSAADSTLHIPLPPDTVYAGTPPANYPPTVPMPYDCIWTWVDQPAKWPQFCALFHERCWNVLTYALPALPQHLDEYMAALHAAYHEIFSPIAQTPANRARIARYRNYLANSRALGESQPADPWRIAEVDIVVCKARLARQYLRAEGPYPSALLPRVRLPLDVQMLIVDQLHDPEDMRSAMIAYDWQFPHGYWKVRFPKEVVFEYNGFKDEHLHWPALYYHTQRLLRESHGLRERQQIVNVVEYVRPWFDELVAKKQDESN